MLNWITARLKPVDDAPSHPLGSDADISAWLAELPVVNPQRVLLAIGEWLEDPGHLSQQLNAAQMARAVGRLDEFATTAVAECWHEVIKSAADERRSALPTPPLERYYADSYIANLHVMQLLAADPEQNSDKRQIASFAARAMHAWVQGKKLARMTYRAPAEDWWATAHALNRRARDLGASHLMQPLYRDSLNSSSAWMEYLIGLLLETLPLSNLTPNAIEAANRLAAWIAPRAQYADTQTGLSLYQIDPEGSRGPERCGAGASAPHLRYLGPGTGYAQLLQLRATLVTSGKQPEWLENAGLSLEQSKELLHTMIVHWSPNPPARTQPRQSSGGKILVVNGLPLVRRMIAASEFARSGRSLDYEGYVKSLRLRHKGHAVVEDIPPPPKTPMEVLRLLETAGDRQMMEQWEVIDESAKGMGVRCISRRPWHTIGALIAYRREDDLDWRIGIVRRLGSSHGTPNAGLTVFEGTPYCSQVRVSRADDGEENLWLQQTQETSGLGWRDAILLSFETRLLLAPPGTFAVDHRIDISIRGRFRPARLVGLEGQGNDYELVRFREAGVAQAG